MVTFMMRVVSSGAGEVARHFHLYTLFSCQYRLVQIFTISSQIAFNGHGSLCRLDGVVQRIVYHKGPCCPGRVVNRGRVVLGAIRRIGVGTLSKQ